MVAGEIVAHGLRCRVVLYPEAVMGALAAWHECGAFLSVERGVLLDSAYQLCVLCATAVWVLLATFVKPLAD
jgi:hypothetical protein